MFDKQEFIQSVFDLKGLPKHNYPVVILCGRSNVGKSSFINSLFNRKDLAKISSTPGKTRSLNYYLIDDNFFIVDLPGYGYAKTSKKEREYWGRLIQDFIKSEEKIVLAFHLIDSRHKPTELDLKLNEYLLSVNCDRIVVLTKSDKLKQSEFNKAKSVVSEMIPGLQFNENLFLYSAVKKNGRKEILSRLNKKFY
ncbi:MAG: YihA family ribosome biogenesis GTP-binding protein [Ignavibacteriales bacterium]|nr:MAG: YihA family ribosome biogenesis GTP-binding protein [Ignavibacteriales bacterium]